MPIQFRCGACNQLLGIATRKAGNVVNCPTCGSKTIVPRESQVKAVAGAAKPRAAAGALSLLERVDVEALLKPPIPGMAVDPEIHVNDLPFVTALPENEGANIAVLPVVNVEPVHDSVVPWHAPAPAGAFTVHVTPVRAALGVALLVALLAGTFLAGMWFGARG